MPRPPLNEAQLRVLRAIAKGAALADHDKVSARALETRRLVRVSRAGGAWTAEITEEGEHYLRHGRYPDPPPEPEKADRPAVPRAAERVVQRQAKRLARDPASSERRPRPARRTPIPASSSTHLEPMNMRYRIVISRVQTAERHVRAASEDAALAKVQAELDKPYGFLGGWTTVDTDLDVVEATSPLSGPPQQIVGKDGAFLLSLKATAAYLGISYSTVYEMVNTGELSHVVVGSRRYVSRDQLTAFIDGHSHTGGNFGLRGR